MLYKISDQDLNKQFTFKWEFGQNYDSLQK